jgi:hypothetical protein
LLKLGRIRLHLEPNPFTKGSRFSQTIDVALNQIRVLAEDAAGPVDLTVAFDPEADLLTVSGSGSSRTVTATYETWREHENVITDRRELQSSWTMLDAPESVRVAESADMATEDPAALVWRHRNDDSIVPFTLTHQGLDSIKSAFTDPLLTRTSGVRISSPELSKNSPRVLASSAPVERFTLHVAASCVQTPDDASWLATLPAVPPSPADRSSQAQMWRNSYVFVDGEPQGGTLVAQNTDEGTTPSRLTSAYVLQRLITVAAAKGNFPIKFNGSIFTVEPRFTGGEQFNPDWRRWGGDYWWQNTRLPYEPMLARGEWNLMDSLFGLYERNMEACKARAKLYYNAEGVYFPETMTGFGTYANNDYGWNRDGLKPSDVQCMYWRWAWQQNLEITDLMLQRYAYSLDEKFLVDRALPMAHETLKFYQTRFAKDADGRLRITPTQAIETYWFDVINDTPTVAGLYCVLDQLRALPDRLVSSTDRASWKSLRDSLPAIPVRERGGMPVLVPAEQYKDQRNNCESPEMYAVYPFRTFGLGHPATLEIARASYRQRLDPNTVGWTQDGQVAAMLGLADDAASNLLAKVRNSNPAFRYPIMWGPNFDWLPDQCHGGNLTAVLQKMLLQCWNGKIHVLPAWPRDWNVRFRLYAEGNTVVECEYRAGSIVSLEVTPASRKADVVLGF